MPDHWTMMEGKEDVAAMLWRAEGAVFGIRDRETVRLEVSGDLAYVVNSYSYTYHAVDEPEQWHRTKNVHVWRRDGTGAWKLALDIWNSDVPMSEFPNE